jgi:hypothetical protein
MSDKKARLRYEILNDLCSGEVATREAVSSDGVRLMVHYFNGGPQQAADVLACLTAIPGSVRGHIHLKAVVGGTPVLVTDYLKNFDSLGGWIGAQSSAEWRVPGPPRPDDRETERPPAPAEPEPREAAEKEVPGDFTRLFVLGAQGADAGQTEAESPPPEPPLQPPPSSGSGQREAESLTEAEQSASEKSEEVTNGVAEGVQEESEEAPVHESAPDAPRPTGGTSEFARLFGGTPVPSDKDDSSPGWGEQDLGAGWREQRSQSDSDDPLAGSDEDYLQQLGAAPSPPAETEAQPDRAPPPPSPAPPPFSPGKAGPSDYTRVVAGEAGPDAEPPPVAPTQPGSTSSSSRSPRKWPYIVGLAAIIVITLALILFFALAGRAPDSDGAEETPAPEEIVSPPEEGR